MPMGIIMKKITTENLMINFIFILICLTCLIPFLLVIAISLSSESDILNFGYLLIPKHIDLSGYHYVFKAPKQLFQSYYVTIVVSVLGTTLSIIIMSMLGYCISRRNNKWRKIITFYVFFTMLFSGGLVPGYILITKYLNLQDTIWVLIIPGLVNAWHVILFSTFFKGIPEPLIESAKIDGANELTVLYKIVIPLSKPVIAALTLFGVLARWNDWYTCLLYIRDENLLTLQYLLQRIMLDIEILQKNSNFMQIDATNLPSETTRMAMVILTTGPILFVFPFFQKYFVKGLMVGSIKG